MNTKKKVVVMPEAMGALEEDLQALLLLFEQRKAMARAIVELEACILPRLGRLPAEGTTHKSIGDMDVKVVTRITRRLDQSKASSVRSMLDENIRNRVFPVTYKLSLRELRYTEDNDPAVFSQVRKTYTQVASKPIISFEQRESI